MSKLPNGRLCVGKIVSEVAVLTIATVLMGIFALGFKSTREREQILHRITDVTRPLAELVR